MDGPEMGEKWDETGTSRMDKGWHWDIKWKRTGWEKERNQMGEYCMGKGEPREDMKDMGWIQDRHGMDRGQACNGGWSGDRYGTGNGKDTRWTQDTNRRDIRCRCYGQRLDIASTHDKHGMDVVRH